MEHIIIDCSEIETRQALHAALAHALDFPACYGGNLDALYDQLTQICRDTALCLQNFGSMGMFRLGFRIVLTDAERNNPRLQICYDETAP